MQTLRTSRGTLEIRTGTEGPKHDPYSYTEYSVTLLDGRTITLHADLEKYLKVDDSIIDHGDYETLLRRFVQLTGIDPHQVEKYHEKRPLGKCSKGGKHQATWEHGHPGEHLLICQKCGEILDSRFVRSEIE